MSEVMVSVPIDRYNELVDTERRYKSANETAVITIRDICTRHGITRQTIMNCPWYQPGYGKGWARSERRKWSIEEYEKWEAIPLDERRRNYHGIVAERQHHSDLRRRLHEGTGYMSGR